MIYDFSKTAQSGSFLVNLFSLLSFFLDGNDTITGSSAADVLLGFEGNDILTGGTGGDNLQGGGGTDTASYATATAGVAAIMQATGSNTGDAAGDTYDSIENLIGSSFNDVLYGTTGIANVLSGGSGNDRLAGRGGADTFNGGVGIDTVSYDGSLSAVRADLLSPATNTGNAAGNTYISIENLDGGSFNDTLLGNDAANVIRGSSFTALASGADYLLGRGGNDTLFGFDNNDRLEGGTGNDVLVGGTGKDSFIFRDAVVAGNRDRITDFKVIDDTIQIDNAVFTKLVGAGNKTLSAAQFFKGAAAHDLNDRIIYNSATGALLYDADGTGAAAAVKFATVSAGLAITNADFFII